MPSKIVSTHKEKYSSKPEVLRILSNRKEIEITELADAHCHLDMVNRAEIDEAIKLGIKTFISNGGSTKSNTKTLEISDGINVFPAIGIDPDNAENMTKNELEFNLDLIRENASRIKSIGEIGLDYKNRTQAQMAKQEEAFREMLRLAKELGKPVSVHSRDAIKSVIKIIDEEKIEKAHIHFFEGNMEDIKALKSIDCMVSIPPLESKRRNEIIKMVDIEMIMAETDAPAAAKKLTDLKEAVKIIAREKEMDYTETARILTKNTKRFFLLN
ncbi:MAG: TatD family hydrolase [Candidatus Micrarchaeia archaeon]